MMMVDQLWMWVVDGNTIITAFPETDSGGTNEADVHQSLRKHLTGAMQQGIKSMNGLVAYIIEHCTGVFHRSDIRSDLAFFEFFADEIGAAKNELDFLFDRFRKTSEYIEKLWKNDKVSTAQMSRALDSLFIIRQETELMERIDKILSDLRKIDFVCSQQEDVLRSLVKSSKPSRSLRDVFETVEYRRQAWSGMAVTAKGIYKSLRDLLDLKQRQANISEARTARYQVEISARQGRSILVLTIVTIIFLPFSVIATILGINAFEFIRGYVSLKTMLAIMFSISFAIATLTLVLAFNETLRDTTMNALRMIYQWLMGMTRLRREPTQHQEAGVQLNSIHAEE